MKPIFRQESLLVPTRFLGAHVIVALMVGFLAARMWYVQIFQGDQYKKISENNRIRKIELPAPRGKIYDRFGHLVLGNRAYYELVIIPQYVIDQENLIQILSKILHISDTSLKKQLRANRGRPKYLPIVLKRNLSIHEVANINSNKVFLPGVEVIEAPRREYTENMSAHLVGYLGEIDQSMLNKLNEKIEANANPYIPGDLVGKHGLERQWEKYLRGTRGFQYIQVDAFGRETGRSSTQAGELNYLPKIEAKAGSNIVLTLDLELQKKVEDAFRGKYGAVIVMNPQNGEILSLFSSPNFDPTIYQDGVSVEQWHALTSDPFHPLLDKTSGGEFAPGSLYKILIAAAALEEKIISSKTTYHCNGKFVLGDQIFQCHDHKGHGTLDLIGAIKKSCDVYFYQVGVELGVDRIAKYAEAFGLGKKLGFLLNMERPGLIPTSAWKLKTTGIPWQVGDTPNIAIGQGYNLLTPLQMVSMFATIASGGKIYRPHLISKILTPLGEVIQEDRPEILSEVNIIKPETFHFLRQALFHVVNDIDGTGRRAQVPGISVGGKTGSVQVVSLKKNQNQSDVSMKWREHAMFAAISPIENAEIAVLVVSENDSKGGGGASAAPVAQKILSQYWELKSKRNIAVKENESKDQPL